MKKNQGWFVTAFVAAGILSATACHALEMFSANGQRANGIFGGVMDARQANSAAGELFPTVMGASLSVQREFRRALPSIYSYSQTAHRQERAELPGVGGAAYASFVEELGVVGEHDAETLGLLVEEYAEGMEEEYATLLAPDEEYESIISSVDPEYARIYCPTTMCAPGKKWVMWDVPFAMRETKKRKGDHLGYEQSASGFATGISYMLGESSAVGLAVGYDMRKLSGRDSYHMRDHADTLHMAVYGGTSMGALFLDGYAGYSRSWHRSERNVYDAGSLTAFDRNKGNYNDTVLSAGMKASYVFVLGKEARITPSVGVDYSHVRFSGLTEIGTHTGGGASSTALQVRKTRYGTAAVPMMLSANKTFPLGILRFGGDCSLWTTEVRGGYVAMLGGERASTRNTFAGLPGSFRATSTTMADSYSTAGAGLKIKVRDKYIFAVDYDVAFASRYQNHSLTAMYGVSF